MTAASGPGALTTLAVATAADVDKVVFGDVLVNPDDVLVMYTYAGDADLSGTVNGDDYFRIDAGYVAHDTGFANGDFDYSGRIDADDYWLIDHSYANQQGEFDDAPLPARANASASLQAVPEPGMLGLLGSLSLTLRRRRR
jgi:hypothetical protein